MRCRRNPGCLRSSGIQSGSVDVPSGANVLQGLSNDKFYCAGSLLRVEMEHPDMPVNYGVPASPVIMFERGPAFETLLGFKGVVLAVCEGNRSAGERDDLAF